MRETVAGVFRQPGARASIALGVILAIIVAVVFVLLRMAAAPASQPNAADRTVAAFYIAVSHQDYAKAFTYLASQQAKVSFSAFEQVAEQIDRSAGPVASFHEIRDDRDANDPNQATIQERVSRTHEANYVVTFQMIGESNGSWLILGEDRTI